jgi:hypothetical protein
LTPGRSPSARSLDHPPPFPKTASRGRMRLSAGADVITPGRTPQSGRFERRGPIARPLSLSGIQAGYSAIERQREPARAS